MTDFDDGADAFDTQIRQLEDSLSSAATVASTFQTELRSMQDSMLYTNREISAMSRTIGGGLRSAFDGLVFDGMRLSDALRTVATSMVDAAYNAAIRPVQNAVSGAIANGINGLFGGVSLFEKGGAFSSGRVTPFARGGVITGPTSFPMRGGTGLMGEAGPEAIMPLTRGADGRLGVSNSGGGRPINITMNVTSPDAEGFRRSQTQIAAQLNRALARGQRNR
ncbi:MAG: phage tail tape measure protein [Pseudomonadota bacterium]